MDPNEWRKREECSRKDREERDKLFERTITLARTQSMRIKMMLDEEAHAEKRGGMRSAYLEHGTGFDPCQIQGASGPTRHYEEITGTPSSSVSSFNELLGLECPTDRSPARTQGTGGQLVQGACPPPPVYPSQRSASDILNISPSGSPPCRDDADDLGLLPTSSFEDCGDDMLLTPPVGAGAPRPTRRGPLPEPMAGQYDHRKWYSSPQDRARAKGGQQAQGACPSPPGYAARGHDMQLTPPATTTSPRTTPVSEHQALLDRARRTVENATRQLNLIPSSAPHPLSHSFTQQRRQPLATLYKGSPSSPRGSPTCPSSPRGSPRGSPSPCSTRAHHSGGDDTSHRRAACPTPLSTRACQPPAIPDDPRLQYRSRLQPSATSCQESSPTSRPVSARTRAASPGTSRIPPGTGVIRRPAIACPTRPTRESVQAAAAAGTLRGTQEEIEAMGFQGRDMQEMGAEWGFVDQNISSYNLPPPEVEGATGGLPGLLKQPEAAGGSKKRVMLKRKVVKITIPPRPDSPSQEMPYTYTPQDPQYGVSTGQLLPPRRLTPSPPDSCYQSIPPQPRTPEQMQSRRDLEADWQRRQECVPSREYPEDKKMQFGKPLPKSFTTGKPKKLPSYRGGMQCSTTPQPTPSTSFGMALGGTGRPQAPTTRTGLVLRTTSSATISRGGSAPPRGGRGGAVSTPRRGASSGPPCRGRPPSRGGRGGGGGSKSPSPTRGSPSETLESIFAEVTERLEILEERAYEPPGKVAYECDDRPYSMEQLTPTRSSSTAANVNLQNAFEDVSERVTRLEQQVFNTPPRQIESQHGAQSRCRTPSPSATRCRPHSSGGRAGGSRSHSPSPTRGTACEKEPQYDRQPRCRTPSPPSTRCRPSSSGGRAGGSRSHSPSPTRGTACEKFGGSSHSKNRLQECPSEGNIFDRTEKLFQSIKKQLKNIEGFHKR